MRVPSPVLERPPQEMGLLLGGVGLTSLIAWTTVTSGPAAFTTLLGVAFFVAAVACFVMAPHIAAAIMIPFYAFIPFLKVFVAPGIGAGKDLLVVAAAVAAAIVVLSRSREGSARVDAGLASALGLLVALYLINPGGSHGADWFHGARLALEPILLLVAGLLLPEPRRTFRWAIGAVAVTGAIEALYGLYQQYLGVDGLLALGYTYGVQVRQVGALSRSFGTLDDSFAYSALLSTFVAAVLFGWRNRASVIALVVLMCIGVGTGFVRTSAIIALGLIALLAARYGHAALAISLLAAAVLLGVLVVVVASEATTTRTVQDQRTVLELNGRTDAWSTALGSPSSWTFGRGVGEVGTGAERAAEKLAGEKEKPVTASAAGQAAAAVDSGYVAAVADVGFTGLAVLIAIFVMVIAQGLSLGRQGSRAGWAAVAITLVLLLDATTRASFSAFPTAFVALFLIGICLAAAREEARELNPKPPPPRIAGSPQPGDRIEPQVTIAMLRRPPPEA